MTYIYIYIPIDYIYIPTISIYPLYRLSIYLYISPAPQEWVSQRKEVANVTVSETHETIAAKKSQTGRNMMTLNQIANFYQITKEEAEEFVASKKSEPNPDKPGDDRYRLYNMWSGKKTTEEDITKSSSKVKLQHEADPDMSPEARQALLQKVQPAAKVQDPGPGKGRER